MYEVKITRTIAAPVEVLYRAWSVASHLQEWLCAAAIATAREGGRFYAGWDEGYWVAGYYSAVELNKRLAWSWHGQDEPGPSQVEIVFEASGEGCILHLTHSQIASETLRQAFDSNWNSYLENLASTHETGEDLRFSRRPILGFFPGELIDAENAAKHGSPVNAGMKVAGVLDGLGAAAAGMQIDDIIHAINGVVINDYPRIQQAIRGKFAGDAIHVELYRAGQRIEFDMLLSKRPLPVVPRSLTELAGELEAQYEKINAELDAALRDVSEAEASFKPAPDEWCVLEVLGHLYYTEIDYNAWVYSILDGAEQYTWPSNNHHRIRALVNKAGNSLAGMRAYLRDAQQDTLIMLRKLPESFTQNRASYERVGQAYVQWDLHHPVHITQMQAAIRMAREQTGVGVGD